MGRFLMNNVVRVRLRLCLMCPIMLRKSYKLVHSHKGHTLNTGVPLHLLFSVHKVLICLFF
jgi:hypothetical protein